MPTILDSSNRKELLTEKTNGIVDFHATWCKPCKAMKPFFEKAESFVKEELKLDFTFFTCDVDAAEDVAEEFHVEKMPTIILFKDGKIVTKRIGAFSNDEEILTFIGAHFDVKKKDKTDETSESDDGRVGYEKDDDDSSSDKPKSPEKNKDDDDENDDESDDK
jgi:thioredoxin 1